MMNNKDQLALLKSTVAIYRGTEFEEVCKGDISDLANNMPDFLFDMCVKRAMSFHEMGKGDAEEYIKSCSAFNHMFCWADTPEGHYFWKYLYDGLNPFDKASEVVL